MSPGEDQLKMAAAESRSLIDEGGRVSALYGAQALPKTFVIDRNGIVVKAIIGKVSESKLRTAIPELPR